MMPNLLVCPRPRLVSNYQSGQMGLKEKGDKRLLVRGRPSYIIRKSHGK